MGFKAKLQKLGNSRGVIIPYNVIKYDLDNKKEGVVEVEVKNAVYGTKSPGRQIS